MSKLSNITNVIIKKKTLQKAKNLISRLTLLNEESNLPSLKNELFQFFSEKENCEEEKFIKQTILLIFKEELIKLGLINDNTNQKNQEKENTEKNIQVLKIKDIIIKRRQHKMKDWMKLLEKWKMKEDLSII